MKISELTEGKFMKSLFTIIFISLLTGVSCSTNPGKIIKDGELSVKKPVENKKNFGEKEANKNSVKVIKVHGMVCAFCTNSIEKKFKKQKNVESVKVDLESKTVTLTLKHQGMPDKEIKKLIKTSGFKSVSIENKKQVQNKILKDNQ